MTSSLNYVPENEYFLVMIVLIVICTLLVIASVVATLIYLKNKRKLGEFITYKQPVSTLQYSTVTKQTANFGEKTDRDPDTEI
jgi:flagellar basal body-associated protein FliL